MTNFRLLDFCPMALSTIFLTGVASVSAQTTAPVADLPVTPLIVAAAPIAPSLTIPANTAAVSSSLSVAAASTPANEGLTAAGAATEAALPDAPSATALDATAPALDAGFQATGRATPNVAPKYTKYVPAGMQAQSINAHDKVIIGLRDLYSPLNFIAMAASAGYEQVLNGAPNYGTDRGAFGERLGAAAIRESTQGVFTDTVFSPLYHTDPRYYVKGQGTSFINRTVYSVTRVLVTRTDSGHNTINAALLTGYAASAALGYTYYPAINQNFRDTASAYGSSLGGAALGFFVSEFADDALRMVHLKK